MNLCHPSAENAFLSSSGSHPRGQRPGLPDPGLLLQVQVRHFLPPALPGSPHFLSPQSGTCHSLSLKLPFLLFRSICLLGPSSIWIFSSSDSFLSVSPPAPRPRGVLPKVCSAHPHGVTCHREPPRVRGWRADHHCLTSPKYRKPYRTFVGWRGLSVLLCMMVLLMGTSSLSRAQLFVTPSTTARQAPVSVGILQARIREWVAMPSSRGSFQPRDRTQVSRIAGGFFTV